MWKLVRAENAIETMVATVRFQEPLSSVVTKRILRELERVTFDANLNNRQALQGIQFNVQNNVTAAMTPVALNGSLFQKTSLVRINNQVVNQLVQQLEFQPIHLVYTTWMYKSWKQERETIATLFSKALTAAVQVSAIGGVRLEYVDRFLFQVEGDGKFSAEGLLNKNSGYISPQIFDAPDLFHSHTGRFDEVQENFRRLTQVNVDAQDLVAPPHLAGHRSIGVTTAVDDQYYTSGREFDSDVAPQEILSTFDRLHDEAIDLFKNVVDKNFAAHNGLPFDV